MITRIAGIVAGVLVLLGSTMGDSGTVLGLYMPDNAQRVGFDLSKLAIDALAIWAIYRGIRPKRKVQAQTETVR